MKNGYRNFGDYYAIIVEGRGVRRYCLVDKEDFEKVNQFPNKWYMRYEKKTGRFYVLGNLNRKTVYLHRYILNPPDDKIVDHKDFDPLNNRRYNIRVVDCVVSNQHKTMQKNNTSGIRGVSWHKFSRRWEVKKQVSGKRKVIGYCKTLEEAKTLLEKTLYS